MIRYVACTISRCLHLLAKTFSRTKRWGMLVSRFNCNLKAVPKPVRLRKRHEIKKEKCHAVFRCHVFPDVWAGA